MRCSNLLKAYLLLAAISATSIYAMTSNDRFRVDATQNREQKLFILPAKDVPMAMKNLYAQTPQIEYEILGTHEDCVALDALSRKSIAGVFESFVSGSSDGSIKIFDYVNGEKLVHWRINNAHVGGVLGVQISNFNIEKPMICNCSISSGKP